MVREDNSDQPERTMIEIHPILLLAIAMVESGNDPEAYDSDRGAYGKYQIRAGYLHDANKYAHVQGLGERYTLKDLHNPLKAERVMQLYLTRYTARLTEDGGSVSWEDLARIHNGGPCGYQKDSAKDYWRRVGRALVAISLARGGNLNEECAPCQS